MERVQSLLGLIGLVLMIAGTIGVIVWVVSTVRRDYPRLGPISFGLAVLGLAIYLIGGYLGGR